MDLDDYAAYETNTADEYLYTVAAPSIISAAKFTGVAADASIATVNGIQTNVAKNYELSASQLLWANTGNKYDFFVDQYGNIIADANLIPTFTYGVITDLQFEQAALGSTSWADVALVNEASASNIVKMYKYNTVGVTEVADPATNDGTVSRYNVYNDEYYYYEDGATNALGVVRVYDLGNGGYNMVPVDAAQGVYDYTANVAKNNPNVGSEIADDDTIFVVKTLNAAGTAIYNTYAGIDAVPTMNGVSFVAVYETDIAAEFVFVDATRALFVDTAYTAVVTNPVAVYSELGQTYTYNVWVDGAAKAVTVTATNPAAANLFAGEAGVYTLSVNADGVVTVQVQLAKFDTTGNTATAPWYVDTIVGLSEANTLDLTTNGAYTVNSAKIYTLYFNDVTDDNAWGAGDTLHSVAGANVNALKVAGANVIYKVNATNATVIDAIYVMAEYVD